MRKKILVFGLIAGLICIAWPLGLITFDKSCNYEYGELFGYLTMLLAFSMIAVAVKNVRDKDLGGFITFGRAFRVGLLVTLVASTVYVLIWLLYFYGTDSNFMEQYSAHMIEQLKSSGLSQKAIDKQIQEIHEFEKMYQNPFFNALITYTEIIPVGLLISLISAAILRKKPKVAGVE